MKCDDPTIADSFDLDVIQESDYEPPGKIAGLIRQIDRSQCYQVQVVQLKDGDFFLRWKERHPEMVSVEEYWRDKGQTLIRAEGGKQLADYRQLEEVLPAKHFELPLSRRQAFALMAACYLPDEFEPEVESLI
jgi:hypothetical protein